MLFDPQTAGGLMATVPAGDADRCIAELKELGYENAEIIGEIVPMHIAADDLHGVTQVVEVV